jgi:hypothetical protein
MYRGNRIFARHPITDFQGYSFFNNKIIGYGLISSIFCYNVGGYLTEKTSKKSYLNKVLFKYSLVECSAAQNWV